MKVIPLANVHWLVGPLNKFVNDLYCQTGQKVIKEIVLDTEQAYRLGLMPGQSATVSTSAGEIKVTSFKKPEPAFRTFRLIDVGDSK